MKNSPARQIIQHTINKEPAQVKNIVSKEIATRVLSMIDAKRSEVGAKLFGRK
jgi:hypothetical protein